jgi:hypothetical protein
MDVIKKIIQKENKMYKLIDNYYLKLRPNNIVLIKKVINKKGEEIYEDSGFFSRYKYLFGKLLKKIIEDKNVENEEIKSIQELYKLIKNIEKKYESLEKILIEKIPEKI